MPPYTPLMPVEPPTSTTSFHTPNPTQHFRGHEAFQATRTVGGSHSKIAYHGSEDVRHRGLANGTLSTRSTGSDQRSHSPLATDSLLSNADVQPHLPRLRRPYTEQAPRAPSFTTGSSHPIDMTGVSPYYHGHHHHQLQHQNVSPYWHTTSTHYASPIYGRPDPHPAPMIHHYHSHPHHPDSMTSATDYESSPASTVDHSLASSYHTRSTHTSPPIKAPDTKTSISHPPPFNYSLIMRQQPITARACGQGERDRRTVDPPPILELRITDNKTAAPVEDANCLLALHCNLIRINSADENNQTTSSANIGRASSRKLMGANVCSPFLAKDEHGRAGIFFVLSDLSCRDPGKHRLRFNLLRLDPFMMKAGAQHPNVAVVESDVFTVFVAKDFPGMRASSALLMALRAQGLNVPLKKGKDSRGPRRGERDRDRDLEEDEEVSTDEERVSEETVDDDDDDGNQGAAGSKIRGSNRGRRRKRRRLED